MSVSVVKLDSPRDIFVCVRCLHTLREGDTVEYFEPDWFKYSGLTTRCAFQGPCDERVLVCRTEHRKEVERRTEHVKRGEHLLVIRDQFGSRYDSYGNFYVVVEKGADPLKVWREHEEDAKEKGEEGCLALEEIVGA